MKQRAISLDFVGSKPYAFWAGRVLAGLGLLSLLLLGLVWQQLDNERAGLQTRLEALTPAAKGRATNVRKSVDPEGDATVLPPELAVPWSALLNELELAARDSHGKIALLEVEPDRAKHQVRVRGQARTLEIALAYVDRLAASPLLRHPMFENHEVKTDDAERPVEFEISAEWVAGP